MCCGDWRSHGSEYYECSRYKSNPNIVNESAGIQAREALKKYLFYFERVCDVKCTYSPVFRFTTMPSLSTKKGLCVPTDMLTYPASSWKGGLAWYWKILWRCWRWDLCFFYLFSLFVDVLFSQDRTQSNSLSTDNVRPEWPLYRPKISLTGHVDWSCTLPFMNKQPNPHLEIRFWLLKIQSLSQVENCRRLVIFNFIAICTEAF